MNEAKHMDKKFKAPLGRLGRRKEETGTVVETTGDAGRVPLERPRGEEFSLGVYFD